MSSAARKGARAAAAAFACGLSLGAAGLAMADTGETGTTPTTPSGAHAQRSDHSVRASTDRARPPRAAVSGAARSSSPTTRRSGTSVDVRPPLARRTVAGATRPAGDRWNFLRSSVRYNDFGQTSARTPPVSAPNIFTAESTTTANTTVGPEVSPLPVLSTAVQVPASPTPLGRAAAILPVTVSTASADLFSPFSGLLGPVQAFVEGIALLVRRTFFNQAPSVAPVQTTGQLIGPITGTVGATDPEGDPLTYAVTVQPRYGSVTLSAAGDYVYTPGAEFTGLDSFNVAVTDAGFHLNLFDLSRPASTEAFLQVAQNATVPMLTFSFVYGSGSQYWSSAARGALQDAATLLAMSVVVDTPTTIVYAVTGESSPSSSTLASAGSDLVAPGAGFFATVVQQKIQSGTDANGSAADGEITFNFGNPWAFGTSVGRNQYDFTSTAMHELLHTFGFLSYTEDPGGNTGRSWTTFDQFLVTADGSRVINNNYRWNSAYNINLTGGGGGLYFGGPNAVAVYGGPVPLYTPWPWEWGSSVTHLDDDSFTGADAMLMNAVTDTGPGVRVLSPVELAILKDLGYTVFEPGPLQALVLIGFGFLRRRAQRPVS